MARSKYSTGLEQTAAETVCQQSVFLLNGVLCLAIPATAMFMRILSQIYSSNMILKVAWVLHGQVLFCLLMCC